MTKRPSDQALAFRTALRKVWATAGAPSPKRINDLSGEVLGQHNPLPTTTVYGWLNDDRQKPPPWNRIVQLWSVLRAIAERNGIDPLTLGSLDTLKELYEAARLAQFPDWQVDDGTCSVLGPQTEYEIDSILAKVGSDRWRDYRNDVPEWHRQHLLLEPSASRILVHETTIIPGLLQTREYADVVTQRDQRIHPKERADRVVDLRMKRGQTLVGPNAPHLWAIIDEGILHLRHEDPSIMRRQIMHLIEMSKRSNVTIQVLPLTSNARTTTCNPLTLFHFRRHDVPVVAYVEITDNAHYWCDPEKVARHTAIWGGLALGALRPLKSRDFLNTLLQELNDSGAAEVKR